MIKKIDLKLLILILFIAIIVIIFLLSMIAKNTFNDDSFIDDNINAISRIEEYHKNNPNDLAALSELSRR